MAAAPASLGTQISEELKCNICLDLPTRPKVLPCQHTFCLSPCLENLAGREQTVKCPVCRQQVRLPPQGVTGLQDNHMVTSLCDKLTKHSGHWCNFHTKEEVRLYCKECNMPVCTECYEEGHDGHPTTGLKKVAEEFRPAFHDLIDEGRNISEEYCSFVRRVEKQKKTLNEQKKQRDDDIIHAYNQTEPTLVQKLAAERKALLLSETQQIYRKNLEKIQTERYRVLADINELSAACDRAKQELRNGWVEFSSQQTTLTEVVGKYRGKAAPTPVQTQPAVFELTDTVPVLGHVKVRPLPSAPIPAVPVPIPAAPAARGTGYHGNEKQGESQRGTFGGEGSENGQFNSPCGVTVSDADEIFVADKENRRIQVFTLQGTFVRQFPTSTKVSFPLRRTNERKMYPHDVAMDGERNLWVVGRRESAEFAVQYNKHGRVLRKFDLQKTGWDRGVAVDTKKNHILITQTTGGWETHGEVLVFRPDGTLVRTVGQQQGMKCPGFITVDGEGNILVPDFINHSVFVYNEDGQFEFQFGGEESGESQLKGPTDICKDRAGNFIVADWGNRRVEMFDETGRFFKHITTEIFSPVGVAMTTQGHLIVTLLNDTVSICNNY